MRTQLPVVGDRAEMFGRGASGGGCEASDWRPPDTRGDVVTQRSLKYGAVALTPWPRVEETRG
jgi:hypothetical protein